MKAQKKKTTTNKVSEIIFKILVGIAILIFAFILLTKTDFSGNSMTFTSVKKSESTAQTPSQLKWFDSFKGVENVPSKKSKESSNGGSGFRYEGFKK